jgi:hypothetical protein
MKTKKIIAILLLIVNTNCAKGQNNNEDSNNDESKYEKIETIDFVAYFPKTEFKIENLNNLQTSNGKGSVNVWTLQGTNGNNPFIYQVSQSVLTKEMIDDIEKMPNTLNVICNGTMMSFASKLGGENFDFKPLNENGLVGMSSTCTVFNENGIINSKAFRVKNYLYMISAGGREIDLKAVEKFLESFKVIK